MSDPRETAVELAHKYAACTDDAKPDHWNECKSLAAEIIKREAALTAEVAALKKDLAQATEINRTFAAAAIHTQGELAALRGQLAEANLRLDESLQATAFFRGEGNLRRKGNDMNRATEREWCRHGYEQGSGLCPYCVLEDSPDHVTPTWLTDQLVAARAELDAKHAKLVEVADKLRAERDAARAEVTRLRELLVNAVKCARDGYGHRNPALPEDALLDEADAFLDERK
jgi:multidrug efflux pump subunit AcrA (membrane-fusion protein)